MRRAILACVSTVIGLIMLLSFKTHALPAPGAAPTAVIASAGPTTPTTTAPPSSAGGGTPAAPSTTSTTAPARTFTGTSVQTRYGPVVVQITVAHGAVTSVDAVEYPTAKARDREINARAVPLLNSETLAAQNANIHTISGATYTSIGYIRSLQSALDQAGLA